MPIPNTLSRKITADFRAEKKYGGRKKICDALSYGITGGQWVNYPCAVSCSSIYIY